MVDTSSRQDQQIDWQMIKAEHEACQQVMDKIKKEEDSPLNSLFFGMGQPLRVYWQNGNFNVSRFEGFSSDFLYCMRWALLVPHLLWSLVTIVTNNGEHLNNFYFWTMWGWWNAIFSQVLSLLAAKDPEYWHVMAHAWLEVSHSLNLAVTFAFWFILVPQAWAMIPEGFPSSTLEWFMLWHMTILHATPLIMTTVNIYFTDIKLLAADWKLMVFHGFFYWFANALGQFDHGSPMYGPLTDWVNHPMIAIPLFVTCIPTIIVGYYLLFCHFQWKRRGEK